MSMVDEVSGEEVGPEGSRNRRFSGFNPHRIADNPGYVVTTVPGLRCREDLNMGIILLPPDIKRVPLREYCRLPEFKGVEDIGRWDHLLRERSRIWQWLDDAARQFGMRGVEYHNMPFSTICPVYPKALVFGLKRTFNDEIEMWCHPDVYAAVVSIAMRGSIKSKKENWRWFTPSQEFIKRGYGRTMPPQEREMYKTILYTEQRGLCAGCRHWFVIGNMDVDHFQAISKGGFDTPDNFQLLCRSCNSIKGTRPHEEVEFPTGM